MALGGPTGGANVVASYRTDDAGARLMAGASVAPRGVVAAASGTAAGLSGAVVVTTMVAPLPTVGAVLGAAV